jgi:hypothetical protein
MGRFAIGVDQRRCSALASRLCWCSMSPQTACTQLWVIAHHEALIKTVEPGRHGLTWANHSGASHLALALADLDRLDPIALQSQ